MANEFDEVLDQESAGTLPPLSSGLEKGEFDDVLDTEVSQQRDYVRNVIDIASKDNPEAAAERVRLSQSTGLPPDVVARNQQELKRREIARAIDLQRMMRDSPVLFRQMTDPTFTAAAIDDLDTLRQIEQSFTNIANYAKSGEMASDAGGAARSLALGGTVGVGKMIFDVFGAATDLVGLDYLSGGYRTMSENARQAMDAYGLQADTSTGRAVKSGLESAGQNLALLPLGLERGLFQTAEAAGAAVAGAMSVGVGADSYQRARGEGVGRFNSALYGINDAGVEFLMEKIPAGQLFKGIELDNSLLKQLAQQTVTEGWTEQVTTFAQDFNEWMALHPEKTTAEFLAERPEAAYQTFIATLIGTGVQTTAIAGINKLVEKASDQALVYEQDRLKRQLQLAGMSALRERSPEQFRANMEQVVANAPDGAPTEIHVDAEVLNQLTPEMQALLPEAVRAQIPDALAMNATVPISMVDVLTIAPGTELEQILNDNARVGSPEAPSRVEAEKAAEFIQQDAERVLQQAQDQSAWQSEVDTVQQTIKGQLDQAGRFTSDVNEGYARLQSQFFSVMASRFGITPTEMYERFSVKVAGQMGQGEVLNAGNENIPPNVSSIFSRARKSSFLTSAESEAFKGDWDSATLARLESRRDTLQSEIDTLSADEVSAKRNAKAIAQKQAELQDAERVVNGYLDIRDQQLAEWSALRVQEIVAQRGKVREAYLAWQQQQPAQWQPSESQAEKAARENYERVKKAEEEFAVSELMRREGRSPTQIKSATGNSGAFDPNDPNILRQSAVQRLQMVAERGVRKTGDRAIITAEERAAMESSSAATGVPIAEIEAAVSKTKLAHPVAQGWAPLTYSRTVVDDTNGDRKITHEYKVISYQFSTDADGKSLEPGTSNYKRRANAVARSMAEEVRTVFRRAGAGDANARNILAQAGWYKALRKRLRQEFGGLGDLFADLLGATSPNTPVRDNWFNAVDALRRASRGDFDNLILQWEAYFDRVDALETDLRSWFNEQLADKLDAQGIVVQKGLSKKAIKDLPEYQEKLSALREARKFPDALLPKKESGAKYGFNGRNVARAMVDLWRIVKNADPNIARGGTAPKALNFSGNLIGFRERATIDVWAARMLQRLAGRRRIPSVAETGVSGEMREDGSTTLQFGFGQDVFSESVRRIRADNELNTDPTLAEMNDDDLQAVVWFIEKELWTVNNWTNAAGEGGSFELEANLTGTSQQDRVKELRSIIDASPPTSDVVAAGQDTSAALKAIEAHEREHAAEIEELRKLQSGEIPPYKGSKKRMEELAKIARPPVEATRLLGNVDRAKGRLEAFNARKVAAKAELTSLEREVDRFVGGLSTQMSMETQGVDFVPADADMNRLAEAIRQAIYAADDGNTVLGSKALSTEGRYGGVERSLDLEVVAREGYDANSLWLEMLRQAQEARQDSTFLSRVLRANEDVDLLRHRPGVEIYFRSAADAKNLEVVLADLAKEGVDFLTVIVDGRRLASTMAGEMPAAVGVRLQYVPEFEQRYGIDDFSGLDDVAIAAKMSAKAEEMDGLAARVLASVEGVSFAGQFWYDTQVAFSAEYQEKIDALTTGTFEGQAAQARGGIWTGQPLRAGLESADRQLRETASGEPGGDVLGGDAGSSDEVLRQSSAAPQARGTFNPQTLLISLGPQSDLSTFLHESGHFFLEVMADLAALPDAPAQVREDMDKVLTWFGVPDLATWQGYTLDQKREHHERWAESFEQYLLEGKAPSAELQPLFRRFRTWLVNVYKSLSDFMRGRNLELNDEIRQVFDRMLATDAEIAQAEEVAGLLPDFDGTNEAIERLQARKMRDLKWTLNARSKFLKQFTREAREARKLILQEVLAEFDQRPDAIAARAIRKVRNKEGAERDAKLEGIAAAQGYGSVQEMDVAVQALGPVNEAVEAEVDRRMTERYGELSTPEALEKAANEAVYNEAHIRSLATELKTQQEALSERQSTGRVSATGRPITVNALVAAAKQFAEDITARRRVRDLKSAAQQHRAATARATKRWEQATRKGETKDAIQAQKDRLLNAQAAKSLLEAQTEVEKTIGYLRKFNKDSIRQKLPPEYLDQIDKLLERVDLRASVSGKQIDKRASLKAWMESQSDLGIDPIIPDNLLEDIRLTSYKMMTVEEIRGLHDTIRNIEHLGKLKSKLLKAKDKREFDAAATAWADNIRANGGEAVVRLEPDGRLTRLFKGFWAEHRKLNSLVRQMDGGQDGGIGFRLLIASMNEQGTQEDVALEKAAAALGPIFAPVDALPGGLSGGQVYIPEISASLSRAARLAIALNWGNTQNRQRVMDGDGWTQAQVEAVLATLTPTELEFVNKVWEHMDSYWPEIKAKQQRVSGLVEEKVAAEPFAIKIADGTIVEMRGGYYPIKYDPDRSVRAQINDAKQAAMDMLRGAMLRPTTRRGHTKARVDEVYGRPIRKDLAPITQHITQVVHDLAWHEWGIDANRLLADKRIAAAIREHYGPETHRAMTDTVEAIVTGDVGKQTDIDKFLMIIRSNVTRSIMGVSATTALLQPFGLTQSMARIGVTPVLKGAWRWAGDAVKMESSLEWIHTKSDFMRLRAKTFNRDLREINQQIQGGWKVTQVMDAVLFAPMQKMQMIADVPTWIGAYEKALSEGQTEELAVAIADEAVLSSQGGGSIKDLSDVQRNHPFLTQFYSYFNATLQLVAESTALTNWKNPRAVAGWVGDMALLAMIPAILPALITYALKGGGEDDEPEDWAKRIAGWQASYLLGMFVGLRDLPAIWGPFDYQGPPAGKLFNDGKRLVQQANQGEIDDPAVLAAISLIGTVLGLPTTQVIRSYKGWQAWDEGDAPASSILFGPPPKD